MNDRKPVWCVVRCYPYEGCDSPSAVFTEEAAAYEWLRTADTAGASGEWYVYESPLDPAPSAPT